MSTKRHTAIVLTIFVGLLLAADAPADTLRVPDPYPTIGAALDAAQHGDRIVVADGTYTGPGNRDLDFAGKRIRLQSESGPDDCIIDCQGSFDDPHRAFHFHSGEPPAVTLEGFTIQNGFIVDGNGGGILCEASSPTIRNCVFRWNTLAAVFFQGGGALANLDGSATHVIDCVFIENAQLGGGPNGGGAVTSAFGAHTTFLRCTFARNVASQGGGVATAIGTFSRFRDCLFDANTGVEGGGGLLCVLGSKVLLESCRFVGNTAYGGGGVSIGDDSQATVRRSVFTGNSATGVAGGGGGINLFASTADVVASIFDDNCGSGDGGAVVAGGDSVLTLQNSTFTGNDAPLLEGRAFGGAICAWGSSVTVFNCVLHANTAIDGPAFGLILPPDWASPSPMVVTASRSLIQDGQLGVFIQDPNDPSFVVNWSVDNFDADPLFVDALGPDGLPWTGDEDLHLQPGSPCIDAGDPAYVAQPGETDIDGDPRVLDGDVDGVAVIDIGADEFAPP